MRTLDKNKTTLWVAELDLLIPKIDGDGFETGEMVKTYSTPTEIRINLYPSSGAVMEQIFGKDSNYDMLAVSNEIVLSDNALLFLSIPEAPYDKTYDFRIDRKVKSLNTYNYGLRSRT